MYIANSLWKFYATYIFVFQRAEATIIRLIQIDANKVVFTLEIINCLNKLAVDYLLSPFVCYYFSVYYLLIHRKTGFIDF